MEQFNDSLFLRKLGSMAKQRFTAIIEKEGEGYVALCPELDIASQGDTIAEASANLKEAVELFLEMADDSEIAERLAREFIVIEIEVDRAA